MYRIRLSLSFFLVNTKLERNYFI
uniref:Uncharacterized protein n=1 Tax=Anguilla anguilla TaxID=7936 RepID=A0A0E9U174_ANGAN